MSGQILAIAGELVAAGVPPDRLDDELPDAMAADFEARDPWHWYETVTDTGAKHDLAARVAIGIADAEQAEHWLTRDLDDEIWRAERLLKDPEIGDDPAQIRRAVHTMKAERAAAMRAWDADAAQASFALDAITTYTAAAPSAPMDRPNGTLADAVAAVEAAIGAAVAGHGPKHVLIDADRGTGKTRTTVAAVAQLAREQRARVHAWIVDHHQKHPGTGAADAATAAREAGIKRIRVLYVAETHRLVGDTVAYARELGLSAEHHAGMDWPFDPADPTSPAICTQPERVKQTRLAGESVPDKACGRSAGAHACPDFGGCRKWQRLANTGRVEFVGSTIDQITTAFMPRELLGFDLVVIDEALDRAGYAESDVPLDHLSDRHFDAYPVLEDGQIDAGANDLAREEYAIVRRILDAAPNGYAPVQALREAGFDRTRWLRLVDLTDRRLRPTGMTSATSDQERVSLARVSFRRQIGSLCMLFRQMAEDGDGWVRLADDENRRAIVRRIATLHPSVLEGRIICLDGSPDVTSWRRFIPDIEVISAPRPTAPFEIAVQIVRPAGKHAMRTPQNIKGKRRRIDRKAYDDAILRFYRYGETGVLTHLEHEQFFAGPGIITGHNGALAGRNQWRNCASMLAFGLPFLSPEAAAYSGAGRTGEAVKISMPVRTLQPQLMKDGGVTLVPSMEYLGPAAREAQQAVRERAAMQGIAGRPRASSRTAENPLLTIYVGQGVIPGMEFDRVITSAEEFAPDRFVIMAATDLVIGSSVDRHRAHPDIYFQKHSADYDTPREIGGPIATLQRILFPSWWVGRYREAWCTLRYWVAGNGNRRQGRIAACPVARLAWAMEQLRERCKAVRIEIGDEVARLDYTDGKLARTPVCNDLTWILGSAPRPHRGPLFAGAGEPEKGEERPPDG